MLTIIAALDENNAIGRSGDIPWDAPEDLKFFQRETVGGAIIMGRKTWESLPKKPLPKRLNCVVSSNPDLADNVFPSFASALSHAKHKGYPRTYAIGGSQIYLDAIQQADRMLLTRVNLSVSDADTWFPKFDDSEWKLINQIVLRTAEPLCELHEYIRA